MNEEMKYFFSKLFKFVIQEKYYLIMGSFMKRLVLFLFILLLTSPSEKGLATDFSPEIINTNKKGVVSITVRASHAAYNSTGAWSGTGFVVNKEKGIILTNRHVIGEATASTFEVAFFNGREADAVVLYTDPLLDFGFLKVDPEELPEDIEALRLVDKIPTLNQPVIMIGKNEGQNFSLNVGNVSSLYESIGYFPTQSYRISLNAQGGASGSPVITKNGDVIALTHSSNLSSAAFALPIGYVIDALEALIKGHKPKRRFTGALVEYHSLDRASKFNDFPEDLIDPYMKKYPDSLNKGLLVNKILTGTPADTKLQLGDVIWKVNGQEIGPNLYAYDKLLNQSDKAITFTVYRGAKSLTIKVDSYDLEKNRVRRLINFGGATFYEADHFIALITGAPYGVLFVSNILPGSSFYDEFPPISGTDKLFVNVVKLNGNPVKNLDSLKKLIPDLIKKEDFYVIYNNYAFYMGHNQTPIFTTTESLTEVSYKKLDGQPQLLTFNEKTGGWDRSEIE